MNKLVKIILYSILGLVALVLAIGMMGVFFAKDIKPPNKKENIDSLISIIRKDTVYHIKEVRFNQKDSDIYISISDKEYSTIYFDNEYHIDQFQSIDGITILDAHGKLLEYNSRRLYRIIDEFKNKYCVGNNCIPLEDEIKKSMNDPDSYEPANLSIELGNDSNFIVTSVFRGKNGFGAKVLNKIQAEMTSNGYVISIKKID